MCPVTFLLFFRYVEQEAHSGPETSRESRREDDAKLTLHGHVLLPLPSSPVPSSTRTPCTKLRTDETLLKGFLTTPTSLCPTSIGQGEEKRCLVVRTRCSLTGFNPTEPKPKSNLPLSLGEDFT